MTISALRRGAIAASRVAAPATTNVLDLPASSGNYATTPDSAATSIVGDLDLRVRVAMDDWTPGAIVTFIAKYGASGTRSYMLTMETANVMAFRWSVSGTTAITKNCTTSTGFTDGTVHWVRVTLDVDNGASQNEVKFWTADGTLANPTAGDFTQLGSTVMTSNVTSIANTATAVEIGGTVAGTQQLMAGRFYKAEIRSGIDGSVVASFDATAVTRIGTRDPTTYVAPTGETWTVNGSLWDWVAV